MKIFLNWTEIQSFDDFYDYFLVQVNAPEWHGRNINALRDSLIAGGINQIEPPFCIINVDVKGMSKESEEVYRAVQEVFQEAKESGRKVRVFNE